MLTVWWDYIQSTIAMQSYSHELHVSSVLVVVLSTACGSSATVVSEMRSDAGVEQPPSPQSLTVQLTDGRVRGSSDGQTQSFIGIPFASPPVGELRWRPPAPVKPWDDVLDATGPGVSCSQPASPSYALPGAQEDCLKLNVFAPAAKLKNRLPVLVWLHGGSLEYGSANQLIAQGFPRVYDGGRLRAGAPRDIVVVTVNYRVGSLGFLAHPALSAEQGGSSGNYGLMDQQAALRWVHTNVSAFGGDPANVTLFGESAGGNSSCLQTLNLENEGLFQRTIVQSGLCTLPINSLRESELAGAKLAANRGCPGDSAEALACLRALPADKALQAATGEAESSVEGAPFLRSPDPDAELQWGDINRATVLTIDGRFLKEQPVAALKAGRYVKVPTLEGTNAREGASFQLEGPGAYTSEANYRASIHHTFKHQADRVAERYSVERYGSAIEASIALVTDFAFVCPARTRARLTSRDEDVYIYNWNRAIDLPLQEHLGPTHAAELAWVWNMWPVVARPDHAAEVAQMLDYWTAFAESGDPNDANAPPWQKYKADEDAELVFAQDVAVEMGRRDQICPFWDEVLAEVWGDDWKGI